MLALHSLFAPREIPYYLEEFLPDDLSDPIDPDLIEAMEKEKWKEAARFYGEQKEQQSTDG